MKSRVVLRRLSSADDTYRVVSLENRIEPQVRSVLTEKQVMALVNEATKSRGTMTVSIKE